MKRRFQLPSVERTGKWFSFQIVHLNTLLATGSSVAKGQRMQCLRLVVCSLAASFVCIAGISAQDQADLAFSSVSVIIDADGKGKLIVDSREASLSHKSAEPTGVPIQVPAFGEAQVFRQENGHLHVVYDFAKCKQLEQLKAPMLSDENQKLFKQLRIDGDENALVLDPGAIGRVRFQMPRLVQGSFEFMTLLSGATEGLIQLQFGNSTELLVVDLNGKNSSAKETAGTITVSKKVDKKFVTLLHVTQPQSVEKEFDFKLDPSWGRDRTLISIAYQGDVPIAIPRIDLKGKMVPSFGLSLNLRGKKVIAEVVAAGSSAEAAGLKVGDTILKINGNSVSDVMSATKSLADTPFDKDAAIEIERFGKKRIINASPK